MKQILICFVEEHKRDQKPVNEQEANFLREHTRHRCDFCERGHQMEQATRFFHCSKSKRMGYEDATKSSNWRNST